MKGCLLAMFSCSMPWWNFRLSWEKKQLLSSEIRVSLFVTAFSLELPRPWSLKISMNVILNSHRGSKWAIFFKVAMSLTDGIWERSRVLRIQKEHTFSEHTFYWLAVMQLAIIRYSITYNKIFCSDVKALGSIYHAISQSNLWSVSMETLFWIQRS